VTSYKAFATVYDRLMEDMPYDKWLTFAEEIWSRYGKPQHVVDLGCGTGALAIPLTHQGIEVTGIDLSASMLRIAAEKERLSFVESDRSSQAVKWLQQNMCAWQTDTLADSVISFCDCLNYIVDEDELLAALQATYNGLREGGSFLFDVHPLSRFEQYAEQSPFVYDENGIAYLWNSHYDEDEHIIEHQLAIFIAEDDERYRRIDELHVQRAYHPMWLQGALREVGFSEVSIFADFQCIPYDEHSERLFFVAIK
jgi:SAM-dependent methyltransferase